MSQAASMAWRARAPGAGLLTLGAPALLWVALWAGIGAGPWYLERWPGSPAQWIDAGRALVALMPLLWLALLPLRGGRMRLPEAAELCWIGYGLLMLLVSLRFDDVFALVWWALAYLSVFAALEWTLSGDGEAALARVQALNRLVWLLATAMLVAMLFLAREVLFVQGETGLTAYGIVHRAQAHHLGSISRTSGMARLAIVPAVVGVVLALGGRGLWRLVWVAVALGALVMIWLFQSRQGIVGAGFALGVVLVLAGGRVRFVGILLMLAGGLLILGGLFPEGWLRYLVDHATRSEGAAAFRSMSGRDLIWHACWRLAQEHPWLGFGPQADRRLLGVNAQSGPLYALLSAGYGGALLYVGGLLWGWVLLFRAWLRRYARGPAERLFLIQAAGIMAYLSIRNVPENSAALYSVDLLLHAPLLAYLGVLTRVRRRTGRPPASPAPGPAGEPGGGVRRAPMPGGGASVMNHD